MNETLRISALLNAATFSVDNDGSRDGNCLFGGTMAGEWNERLNKLRKIIPGFRCTISERKDTGSFNNNTHQYDGIVGDLLYGKADLTPFPFQYPVAAFDDDFVYTRPTHYEKMTIFSVYNTTAIDENLTVDISAMFHAVPKLMWTFLCISFVAYVVYQRLILLIRGQTDRNILWSSFASFIDQNDFPSRTKFWSLLFCFGLFFANSFLENCISTDLVVVEEPIAVKNYDDISRNITVFIPLNAQTNYLGPRKKELLKNAETWYWNRATPIDSSIYLQQKIVALAQRFPVESFALGCMAVWTQAYPNVRGLLVADPSVEYFTSIRALRKDFIENNPEISKYLLYEFSRNFEAGISIRFRQTQPFEFAKLIFGLTREQSRLLTDVVEVPSADFKDIALHNVIQLFAISFGLILFSLLIFVLEKFRVFEKIKTLLAKSMDSVINLINNGQTHEWFR